MSQQEAAVGGRLGKEGRVVPEEEFRAAGADRRHFYLLMFENVRECVVTVYVV